MRFLFVAFLGISESPESRDTGSHAENVKKKYEIHHEQFNLRWDPEGVCLSYDEKSKITVEPCDGYNQRQKFLIVETTSELVYHADGKVNQEESDKKFKMLIVHAQSKKCLSTESTKDLSECNIDQVNQHFSCINWSLYADSGGLSGIFSGHKELVLQCKGKNCDPKFVSDTKKNSFTDLKWIVQSPVIETVISVCKFIPKSDASSIYRIDTLDGDRCQIPFYSRKGKLSVAKQNDFRISFISR